MKTSEAIDQIATAMAKAQSEMRNAAFNRTNPHFKSKYADLGAIRDAITKPLTDHGLSVVQTTEMLPAGMMLLTRLLHTSGQWIESEYPVMADMEKPQAMGSAMTYAKRYSLAAICNIASEEDDDANAAQEQAGNAKKNDRFLYERLINTMRSTKTLVGLEDWKERNNADIQSLADNWFNLFKQAYAEHKGSMQTGELPKPVAKPKNGASLSEQALEANKPPMPADGLPDGY